MKDLSFPRFLPPISGAPLPPVCPNDIKDMSECCWYNVSDLRLDEPILSTVLITRESGMI